MSNAFASDNQGTSDQRDLVFTAVRLARTPMVICDPQRPDVPIVLANEAFLELTGYSASEVIGRNCRFLQGPETNTETVRALTAALADARDIEIEVLNYRKDGSTFWNRLSISPVRDETGRLISFFGSQADVTQHRKARFSQAEDERILLREIDHRAMNALAIVEGIVRLSRARDINAYIATVQKRVQALAKAHAFLAESRWRNARLDDLLRLLIAPRHIDRTRMDGPVLHVGAPLVQPLALVLHEMIANAETHGCLSSQAGKLNLSWTTSNGGGGFSLTWEESGGPPPSERREGGFGTAMISAIIERQLRGQASLQWPRTGLRAEFRVPKASGDSKSFQVRVGP